MKYSKTALMELSHKYAKILRKCAYLNAIAIMGIALPTMADWTLATGATFDNLTENKESRGDIYVVGLSKGEYDYSSTETEEKFTIKASDNQISAKRLWVDIQTYKPEDIHPEITVLGDENTTLNLINNVNATVILSRFGKVNLGSSDSSIGTINIENRTLNNSGLIYVTSGNGAADADMQELNIYGNNINLTALQKNGQKATAITGNEGHMTLVAKDSLNITGHIEAFNEVYGGRSNMVFNINQNEGNSAVTTINGSINAAKGSEVNIGLKGEGSSITGDLLVSAEGTNFPGGKINLTFGKNGQITGSITAQDKGQISILGSGIVNINGDILVGSDSSFVGKNLSLNGSLTNNGTVNVSGDLNLEGGITGNGVINFTKATNLTARLLSSAASINAATIKGLANVSIKNLIVENNLSDGTYKLLSTGDADFHDIGVNNALYTFTQGENAGEIKVSKKSSTEIVDNLTKQGVDNQIAGALTALTDSEANTPVLNKINEALQTGNTSAAAQMAQDLAPTTSQEIMGIAQGVNHILSNVANNRMAAIGRSSGDAFVGGALWAQGLYNYTKQDKSVSTDGFKAHMNGLSFGVDGKVNDNLTVGIGYGYTDTDADAGARDIDIKGHNIFAYSEYQQGNWYVNGMLNYGFSKYTEKKAPAGVALKAKYDVHTYAANMMTGYHFDNGFTPEVGLRYLFADQDAYNDGVQRIKTDNNDVLTGVAAIKYHQAYQAKDWTFKPNLRLGATYDMMSDNGQSVVNVIGGSSYQINSKRLNRFGVETGVGVEAIVGDWNLSLDYNGGFRADFQSHTGMLKAKYNF